jgi:hypothetical protein
MVILAILYVPLFAALMALSSARRIAAAGPAAPPFDSAFFTGLLYVVLILMPVIAYFYHAYPAWSILFLMDPLRLPITFGIVLASLAFVCYFFFYLGTHNLLRVQRAGTAWLAASQPALLIVTFAVIFSTELASTGNYYLFHAGSAEPLAFGSGLGEAVIGLAIMLLPAVFLIFRNFYAERAFPPLEPEDSKWQ